MKTELCIVQRKSDGKYWSNSPASRRSWNDRYEQFWTDDLSQVKPYRTTSAPRQARFTWPIYRDALEGIGYWKVPYKEREKFNYTQIRRDAFDANFRVLKVDIGLRLK